MLSILFSRVTRGLCGRANVEEAVICQSCEVQDSGKIKISILICSDKRSPGFLRCCRMTDGWLVRNRPIPHDRGKHFDLSHLPWGDSMTAY